MRQGRKRSWLKHILMGRLPLWATATWFHWGSSEELCGIYLRIVTSRDREAGELSTNFSNSSVKGCPRGIKFQVIPEFPAHKLSQLTQYQINSLIRGIYSLCQKTQALEVGSWKHIRNFPSCCKSAPRRAKKMWSRAYNSVYCRRYFLFKMEGRTKIGLERRMRALKSFHYINPDLSI